MKLTAHKRLLLILAVAFVLRLATGWAWQARLPGRFGMGDSDSYWTLGLAIAQGEPYECGVDGPRVFRTPGYPLLLAPILWCAGDGMSSVMLARAEAALFGTLAVAAVWWLTRRLFDDRAATLAAVLAALYPGGISLSVFILSEAPFCPLMLLNLGLWIAAWQSEAKPRRTLLALAAGMVAGAATLMRPSWLLFTPFGVAAGMLLGAKGVPTAAADTSFNQRLEVARQHLWIGCWMAVGMIVVLSPWWIRNAYVTGRFVPTTLQVGASLYDGLGPQANGGSNMDFVPRFIQEEIKSPSFEPKGRDAVSLEIRLDERFRAESSAWVVSHPAEVIRLAWGKFLRMWNVWPNEPRLSSWPLGLAVLFTYTPMLICAIIGAIRTIGRGWPYILCWLPAVYFTALHVVFVSSIRYREPAMLALLVLASGAIAVRSFNPEPTATARGQRQTPSPLAPG